MDGPVVGVLGGSGGAGASTVAAALAHAGKAVLLDLDVMGGGIDVLLGAEDAPGPRWSGLRLGGGRLDPQVFAAALPYWSTVPFLSADAPPDPEAARQVVDVARALGPVVLDLPRWPGPVRDAAAGLCALVVLVVGADVRSVSAARAVTRCLPDAPIGALVHARRGAAAPARVAEVVGVPLLGSVALPRRDGDRPLAADALPRALLRVARGIWDGLDG